MLAEFIADFIFAALQPEADLVKGLPGLKPVLTKTSIDMEICVCPLETLVGSTLFSSLLSSIFIGLVSQLMSSNISFYFFQVSIIPLSNYRLNSIPSISTTNNCN